jgi:antitoxin component of MazEF toxin-antitoxin module
MTDVAEAVVPFAELVVDADGNLVIPREILAKVPFMQGDPVYIQFTGEGLLLLPLQIRTAALAAEAEDELARQGITLDDLLAGIADAGEELFRERYGSADAG